MVRAKALIVLVAAVATVASAPAQDTKIVARKAAVTIPAMESDEQIVADFLRHKERAERAQKAIIHKLRKQVDQKRAEFEFAKKSFDEARGIYETIIGPLPKQGVMSPSDPRLPYEFDVRRLGTEPRETRLGNVSPGGPEPAHK